MPYQDTRLRLLKPPALRLLDAMMVAAQGRMTASANKTLTRLNGRVITSWDLLPLTASLVPRLDQHGDMMREVGTISAGVQGREPSSSCDGVHIRGASHLTA